MSAAAEIGAMPFTSQALVRCAHVDAAGIVFYPRYFEMANGAVEDFFAQHVGVDFHSLHLERGLGVPTVKIVGEFVAPSRLGDMLDISVAVSKLGASSLGLHFAFSCNGQLRMTMDSVLVCMDLGTGRPQPWPLEIRELSQ